MSLNDYGDFRDACHKAGITPLPVIRHKQGDILIGEQYFDRATHEYPGPHWRVVWHLRREGDQPFRYLIIEPWQKTPAGLSFYVSPEERKRLALEDVNRWIEDNIEIGEFT